MADQFDALSGSFNVPAMRRKIEEDQEMYANGLVFQSLLEQRLVSQGVVGDENAAKAVCAVLIGLMIECGYSMVSK